ncbi:MAG: AsmA family protein [Verrucomicrobia bacterium]|nr:AsmA family protein [Verrucomicrobiota bacterium]
MKFLKGCLIVLVVVIVVLSVGVKIAKDRIVAKMAEAVVENSTGFDLELEQVKVGLLKPTVDIRGLTLNNPPDYPDKTAFHIEQIFVRYDRSTLFSDEIFLPVLTLDIPQVFMVRKADGEMNLERLGKEMEKRKQETGREKSAEKPTPQPEEQPSAEPAQKKVQKNVRIGELTLRIGSVEIRDYSAKEGEPQVQTVEINLDRTYHDVASLEDIGPMITQEVIVRALPSLMNGNLKKILSGDDDGVKKAGKDLEKIGKQLEKSFKGLFKEVKSGQ